MVLHFRLFSTVYVSVAAPSDPNHYALEVLFPFPRDARVHKNRVFDCSLISYYHVTITSDCGESDLRHEISDMVRWWSNMG